MARKTTQAWTCILSGTRVMDLATEDPSCVLRDYNAPVVEPGETGPDAMPSRYRPCESFSVEATVTSNVIKVPPETPPTIFTDPEVALYRPEKTAQLNRLCLFSNSMGATRLFLLLASHILPFASTLHDSHALLHFRAAT